MRFNNSKQLLRLMILIAVLSFILISASFIYVFTTNSLENYNNSLRNINKIYSNRAKMEAQDKIQKLVDFIDIYKGTLEEKAKESVKENVDAGLEVIKSIYRQFSTLPKNIILQKIRDSLRNKRYTIRRAINLVKTKNESYSTWWWYKIGEKKMKKKIGFVEIFKPLGIFIGAGRYEEDILKQIKKYLKKYLSTLQKDQFGYIFAYDVLDNTVMGNGDFKNINRWNDVVHGRHIVRDAIRGAYANPDGFFMDYLSRDGKKRISYVKLIPGLNWVIGTQVQDYHKLYIKQKKIIKEGLKQTIYKSVLISFLILSVMLTLFLLLSIKIKKLFKKLEHTVENRTVELIEQKNIFKKLFDTASDGIALSKNRKIYECNSSTLRIFEAIDKDRFLQLKTKDYFPDKQGNGENSMELIEKKLDIARKEGRVEFEIMAKTLNGRDIWLNIAATQIVLQNTLAGYFVFRDITQRKRVEKNLQIQQKKLIFQAKHDPLTSLPNRMFLMDRLSQGIKRAKRGGRCLAVAFMDIDNFKIVNDAFGHDMGDLLLIEIASVLRSMLRVTDTVSRVSGDEFVLIIDDLSSIDDNTSIIQKIVDRFQEPFYIKNNPFSITFSIGISIYPNDAQDEQDLLKYADMAMYRAKNSGKNRYIYYDESMNSNVLEHIKIEQEIRDGMKNDEFILHYQPQLEVKTGKIVGFEALVRWQHPRLGLKYPDYFIQLAENSSLMIPLGEAISKKAMHQTALWYAKGLNPGIMSINFTSKQLESSNFFEKLEDLLKETGCRPEWIEAELVERYVMRDTKKTTDLLRCFRDIGIKVAIDDFGTGYSSLSYLKYLEISKLKIDKAFIDELENDKKDQAITKSIIDLSIGLDLEVLAEGVETEKQYEILKDLGCQIIQGYYFSRPISGDEAQKLLAGKSQEKQQIPR
ncbi:MAG: EAL domain-containing protein [Sulfurospirillum sp.]